jgi:hypothetical protein
LEEDAASDALCRNTYMVRTAALAFLLVATFQAALHSAVAANGGALNTKQTSKNSTGNKRFGPGFDLAARRRREA